MPDSLFNKNFIFLDYEVPDQLTLLNSLASVLQTDGYVKSSYAQAIIEREETFPTGLNTPDVKIAMPHTYPVHVLKPAILVATLKNPVLFREMGNSKNTVAAQMIFLLAISDPHGQVSVLSKLMSIFSDGKKLSDLYMTQNKIDMLTKLENILM